MAEIDRVDKKREADRRTALLALAAAGEGRAESDCLTDDNLACLVEHLCTEGEQKQYMCHLAGCETCYRRWLQLTKAVQEHIPHKKTGNIHQLFRPRQLAWAGSMLAAAASVILYLNISGRINVTVPRQKTESGTSYRVESLPEAQSIEQAAAPAISIVKNMEDMSDDGEPEKKRVAAPVPAAVKEVTGSGQFSTAGEQARSATPQKAARQKLSMEDEVAEESALPAADFFPLQDDTWFADLQQACLAGDKNSRFWQQMYLQGKEIVMVNGAEREELVKELLPMVQRLQQSPGSDKVICQEILARLQ
jgi:hypothetical protein